MTSLDELTIEDLERLLAKKKKIEADEDVNEKRAKKKKRKKGVKKKKGAKYKKKKRKRSYSSSSESSESDSELSSDQSSPDSEQWALEVKKKALRKQQKREEIKREIAKLEGRTRQNFDTKGRGRRFQNPPGKNTERFLSEYLEMKPGCRLPTRDTYLALTAFKAKATGFPDAYQAKTEFTEFVGDVATLLQISSTIDDKEKCVVMAIDPAGVKILIEKLKADFQKKKQNMNPQIQKYYNALGQTFVKLYKKLQDEHTRPDWLTICDKSNFSNSAFDASWCDFGGKSKRPRPEDSVSDNEDK